MCVCWDPRSICAAWDMSGRKPPSLIQELARDKDLIGIAQAGILCARHEPQSPNAGPQAA